MIETSAQRKKQARQLMRLGTVLVGVGLIAAGVALVRWLVGGGTWIDVALAALVIILLIPTGFYLIVSSATMIRLLDKEQQALVQELDALE
jgi:magnesium-transporting ATPase (P-type)